MPMKTWTETIQDAMGGNGIDLQMVSGTISTNGDNQIIEAPTSNLQIHIVGLIFQNETSNATTVTLKFGDEQKMRLICPDLGGGLGFFCSGGRELKAGIGNAVKLNLSASNQFNYTFIYYLDE